MNLLPSSLVESAERTRVARPKLVRRSTIEPRPPRDGAAARARQRKLESWFHHLFGPLVGALIVAVFLAPNAISRTAPIAAFLAFSASAAVARRNADWVPFLPFAGRLWRAAGPLLALGLLAILKLVAVLPGAKPSTLIASSIVTALVSRLPETLSRRSRNPVAIRTAVIGSVRSATILDDELRLAGVPSHVVVGAIAPSMNGASLESVPAHVGTLGSLAQLREAVVRHRIDLLVMTAEVPRLALFRQIADTCVDQPVRLWELSALYEELFGHVPVAEINAAWFQYVLHPRYRYADPGYKRALDLIVAASALLASLPLLLALAFIIKRDGGPILFNQRRIGRGGTPFTLYKLRSMREESVAAQWASVDDPRVTSIGRFMRRTHLDELPQLVNVLRGEMSLVGPRPEQPEFVERLEGVLEFYRRRHAMKPGITGWAQVRCGYARSDVGSAWKLCHDLYYLKHRSMMLDLMLLLETVRTVFFERAPAVEPPSDRLEPMVRALEEP